tara:strand:- start:772 stop:2103 length:1332 start_codon:yes stop_codon:yes gene_type:complete
MNILKIIKEEVDGFDWVRDVKTNDTIAKEIYNTIEWHKIPDVTTDYIEVPWIDIVFSVSKITQGDSKLPIISPSSFHKGFKEYLGENYGLFFTPDIRKVYNKIKELMGDKIHRNINESEDFDWIKNIEPRKHHLDFRVGDVLYVGEDKDNPRFTISIVYIKDKDVQYEIIEIGPYEINNDDEKVGEIYDIGYVEVTKLLRDGYWKWYKKVDEPITESEDLNWIQDVKSDDSVRFDDDKLYYFNPPLTRHEVLDLMERIPNEIRYTHVKKWFDSLFLGERPHNYMTYFSINSDSLNDNFYVGGWCDETHWTHANGEFYEEFEPVNGRDKFFGHYRIKESSNDFNWVDEIPLHDFYNGDYYIDISELDDDEACEVQQVILNLGFYWRDGVGLSKRHCNTYLNKGYMIQNGTLYRTPRSYDEYIDTFKGGDNESITYVNGRTDLLG